MQKNRLLIVLACLNCVHTTHAVESNTLTTAEHNNDEQTPGNLPHYFSAVLRDVQGKMNTEDFVHVKSQLRMLDRVIHEDQQKYDRSEVEDILTSLPSVVYDSLVFHTGGFPRPMPIERLWSSIKMRDEQRKLEKKDQAEQAKELLKDRKGALSHLTDNQWNKLQTTNGKIEDKLNHLDRLQQRRKELFTLLNNLKKGKFPDGLMSDYDVYLLNRPMSEEDERYMNRKIRKKRKILKDLKQTLDSHDTQNQRIVDIKKVVRQHQEGLHRLIQDLQKEPDLTQRDILIDRYKTTVDEAMDEKRQTLERLEKLENAYTLYSPMRSNTADQLKVMYSKKVLEAAQPNANDLGHKIPHIAHNPFEYMVEKYL